MGVLVAGPNFYSWAVGQSSLVVFGSVLLGGVVGRLAVGMALAFMPGGAASAEPFGESEPMAAGLSGTIDSEAGEQGTTVEGG